MYMITMPVAEARSQFSQIIDSAVTTHQRVEVTKNGRRAAVLLGADDFDSLMETLDILSDSDLVKQISESLEQMSAGEWYDEEDVRAAMAKAGRG